MKNGSGTDHRAHPRKLVTLPVSVADADHRVEGRIEFDTRDLSVGGAFLRSDLLLEVGEELQLTIHLPDTELVAHGRVVHVVREPGPDGAPGMGVAFTDLSDADRESIRTYLARA